MSKLEQLVGAAREDVERRKQRVPISDLRDAVGTLSGSRPFTMGGRRIRRTNLPPSMSAIHPVGRSVR